MSEFVTFEISKKLKEKGFPQGKKNTLAMYNEDGEWFSLARYLDEFEYCFDDFDEHDCVAPTIAQVLKWLRDKKNTHIEIYTNASGYDYIISDTPKLGGTDRYWNDYAGPNDSGCWDSYEEAAFAGIEYVLDNLI